MRRPEILSSRLRVGPLGPSLVTLPHDVCSSFQFRLTLRSAISPFPFGLAMYKMQFLRGLEIGGAGKAVPPRSRLSSHLLPRTPSRSPCPGALRLQGLPGAVDACSFGPLSDFVFSCSSFRASLYGRSSLTSPISEVTGMERLEIGFFFGKNKPFIYCH